MKTKTISCLTLATVLATASFSTLAQEKSQSKKPAISSIKTSQPYVLMNANNLTSWVRSDGSFPAIVKQTWNGEFPKGSGVGTVYQEGIVFGGKVHDGVYADSIRVTGNTYFNGMQPGSILTDASGNTTGADNPRDAGVRAFAVRPDMPASIQNDTSSWPDLTPDAASYFQKGKDSVTSQDIQQIAAQYFKDWTEWPATKGAPWFVDSVKIVHNDASYDPTNPHDIPGIPDAAKTIWFVCNDLNPPVTAQFAGSHPIGIEQQVTLWAFVKSGTFEPLNNVIFKQVKMIYKGNLGADNTSHIDSMFVSQWVDGDIGDAGDDYGGCDTMLNLGYQYNSQTLDAKYSAAGISAPAMGYVFLEGTSQFTGTLSDSAVTNFQMRKGYRYSCERPMTSFFLYRTGTSISDPDNATYAGTLQWFNVMRARLPRPAYPSGILINDCPVCDPNIPPATNYMDAGDPITGTGWVDGFDVGPGARRMVATHGPFGVALHDTAEVVIALVDGLGADNLWSVRVLKYNAGFAKFWFNGMTAPSSLVTSAASNTVPRTFKVSQNYPNPFNPSTTIKYQIPSDGRVTIRIFNLLGQEVASIENGLKKSGSYSVEWNASNAPSGVYFYQTELTPTIGNKGSLREVKKMILLK